MTEVGIGVAPGEAHYFRITAYDMGGESLPTRTVVVRTSPEGLPSVLLVDGFNRIDERMNSQPRKCPGWKTPYEVHHNVSVAVIV